MPTPPPKGRTGPKEPPEISANHARERATVITQRPQPGRAAVVDPSQMNVEGSEAARAFNIGASQKLTLEKAPKVEKKPVKNLQTNLVKATGTRQDNYAKVVARHRQERFALIRKNVQKREEVAATIIQKAARKYVEQKKGQDPSNSR